MQRIWMWVKSPGVMAFVALFSIGLAVYQGFFYEKKPDLVFRVDALSPVFDIHQPVGGLSISYAGEDLRSAKKTLWVFKATASNSGNAEIKKGDFDEKAPWGLEIENAEIVDHPTVSATNSYLEKNLDIKTEKKGISFSPVILEPNDSIEITLLLLGPEASAPVVHAIGKISGVRKIGWVSSGDPDDELSIWRQAIKGRSFGVQIIRGLVYFAATLFFIVGLAALVIGVLAPFSSYKEKREKRARETQLRDYRRHSELPAAARYFMDVYLDRGERGLAAVMKMLIHYRGRQHAVTSLREKGVPEMEIDSLVRRAYFPRIVSYERIESELRTAKLIVGEGLDERLSDGSSEAMKDLAEHLAIDLDKLTQSSVVSVVEIVGRDGKSKLIPTDLFP